MASVSAGEIIVEHSHASADLGTRYVRAYVSENLERELTIADQKFDLAQAVIDALTAYLQTTFFGRRFLKKVGKMLESVYSERSTNGRAGTTTVQVQGSDRKSGHPIL
jgi:hypothetical protein